MFKHWLGGVIAGVTLYISLAAHANPGNTALSVREGMVIVAIEDDFKNMSAKQRYFLKEDGKPEIELRLNPRSTPKLRTGQRIRVKGYWNGKYLDAAEVDSPVQTLTDPRAHQLSSTATSIRKVVVILVDIQDGIGVVHPVNAACDGVSNVVAETMYGAVSGGQNADGCFADSSFNNLGIGGASYPGGVQDVVRVSIMEASSNFSGVCNETTWANAADAAAAGLVNVPGYQHKIYVIPTGSGCTWAGLGYFDCTAGCRAWVKTYSSPVCGNVVSFAHELGHNIGFDHSGTDANNDGVMDNEYGDLSDFMGAGGSYWRTNNAPHKVQMGWVPSSSIIDGANGGTFTVSALEITNPAYPQVIRILPATGRPYYLSFRAPIGYDSTMPNGATYLNKTSVHRFDVNGIGNDKTFFVQALGDGESYSDTTNTLTFTQLAHDATSATIRVALSSAPEPVLSISDTSVTEGNSGTKTAYFLLQLSAPAASPVTLKFSTVDGTATAGSDYVVRSLVAKAIPAGSTEASFGIVINGDLTDEPDETLGVTLSDVVGATVTDGSSQIVIINDDRLDISVMDASVTEGNSGTKTANFTVQLSKPAPSSVSLKFSTQNGTATAGSDYVARVLSAKTIPAGASTAVFGVVINGDTTLETNETLYVVLSNVVGATVADGTGQITVANDDVTQPNLTMTDGSVIEGNSGTRLVNFTVNLSAPTTSAVKFNFSTANGTAIAGSDYVARTLVAKTVPAGATSASFGITVNGDTTGEANETFLVNLSSIVGAVVIDGTAQLTITNDDAAPASIARVTGEAQSRQ